MTTDDVLLSVRRSYRLLHLFQRRVLDLASTLSEELGQNFYWWCPANETRARQSYTNPCNDSAWRTLPIYNASCCSYRRARTRTPRKVGSGCSRYE